MRILVTGANGFIGTHLCQRLLGQGVSVRVALRTNRAKAFLPGVIDCFVIGDVREFSDWRELVQDVDVVVHLAGRAHIARETATDPLAAYRQVNVQATRQLLQACSQGGVRRVVFLSTIGAVGRGDHVPYQESVLCQPEDAYGLSKLEAEQIVSAANNEGGLETVILRPPLVYGPGVHGNFLRIMKLVQKGIPLPLGRVESARSMIYVENLIDAIVLCLRHPQAGGEIFHVADPKPITAAELVEHLARNLDRPARLPRVPVTMLRWAGKLTGRSLDVDRLIRPLLVSSSKITRTLGWQSSVATADALQATVASFLGKSVPPDSTEQYRRLVA